MKLIVTYLCIPTLSSFMGVGKLEYNLINSQYDNNNNNSNDNNNKYNNNSNDNNSLLNNLIYLLIESLTIFRYYH